ncbi:MAG: guanylate kinase [Solirubrobacterales bacterium]
MSRVFVITGPSGVGKGTLMRELCEQVPEVELSISATTRDPRRGEEDGTDYHFLSREEFDRRVAESEFLEWATYSGNRYGTLRREVERRVDQGAPVVLEIEVQGARQVRETMPEAVRIFIEPPDPEVLRERLEGRGTDGTDVIERRLEEARKELRAADEFSHRVTNDEVDRAANELAGIVRSALD